MTNERSNIADELSIDEYNLDKEWLAQAGRVFRYGVKLADAERDLDEVKSEFDVRKAEIYREVAADPSSFGLEKTTEAAINSVVIRDSRYLKSQRELFDAKHDAKIYEAAVKAFIDRKKALEKLVDLQMANYHGEPHASAESREHVEHVEKAAIRRGGVKRKRKTKQV